MGKKYDDAIDKLNAIKKELEARVKESFGNADMDRETLPVAFQALATVNMVIEAVVDDREPRVAADAIVAHGVLSAKADRFAREMADVICDESAFNGFGLGGVFDGIFDTKE